MSASPQPSWHADQLQGNPKRQARLWHLNSGVSVNSSTDLARMYWRRAVSDNLPERPVVLLTQSSLWDSILAKESYLKTPNVSTMSLLSANPDLLRSWGSLLLVQQWRWTEHAEAFLQALLDSGLPIEKTIWRTNANCPVTGKEAPFINMVSQKQANEARQKIAANQGLWRDVLLMDWRKDFNATSPGWCNGIHYSPLGYQTYIESLWDTLRK